MIQLEKYSFDKGGSLVFDDNDELSDISSIRLMDNTRMLKRLMNDDPDDSPLYIEAGPFLEPKEYYISPLNHRGEQETGFEKGALLLLRMFFDLMQEPCDGRKPFVLTHPDFDFQNFIVSENGELRGIIDWDSISAVPRTLGNEQLSGWLTRDWDPVIYVWNEEMEQGIKPDNRVWEDSPETLKFYRSVYTSAMRSCRNNEPLASSTSATLTSTSLIYQNLFIAASDPLFMTAIMIKVFGEIASLVQDDLKDDEDEFAPFDVADALAENRLSEHHRAVLTRGFQRLLERSAEL